MFESLKRLFSTKIERKGKTILVMDWKDLNHPYAGGGVLYAFKQAENWVKQGYRVIFLTPRFKGSSFHEEMLGCEVYRIGGKYTSYLWFPLWYLFIFRKSVDYIVDIENGIPYFTPLYSRKPKILLLFHVQRMVFFRELPFFIAWLPYLMEIYLMPLVYRKNRVVTISHGIKEELHYLGFKRGNITISYCGLDLTQSVQLKKFNKPTVLCLGRVEKYKRVDLLIDMFERLNFPESHLIIAGSGRALDQIKSRVERSPIKNQIKILGRVSEEKKFELYARSWLAATASEKEGWGMTVIEGNACGTPTLGFNISGLNESIQEGVNGMLANSEQEFIVKMGKILSGDVKFIDLPKHASQYSWEINAQKTLNVLTNA